MQGRPRSLVEAAAASGMVHATADAVAGILEALRVTGLRNQRDRVALMINAFRDEWQWSELDAAAALAQHVSKGKKRTTKRCSGAAQDKRGPELIWSDLLLAMDKAEADKEIPEPRRQDAGPSQDSIQEALKQLGKTRSKVLKLAMVFL